MIKLTNQSNSTQDTEALSLGKTDPPVECSKERWHEVFREFNPKARYHAANLAAHSWDVLLVGGRVLLTSYYSDLGHWLNPDFSREDATDQEMEALYERPERGPKVRKWFKAKAQQ